MTSHQKRLRDQQSSEAVENITSQRCEQMALDMVMLMLLNIGQRPSPLSKMTTSVCQAFSGPRESACNCLKASSLIRPSSCIKSIHCSHNDQNNTFRLWEFRGIPVLVIYAD
jgi:hypothetical protein